MLQQFRVLSTTDYLPDLAAVPFGGQPTRNSKLGICLSGGGSRALSCALGQLSALNEMIDPRTGQSVLDQVAWISSVSGGNWAAVLYTYLPQIINGQSISDADFLIQPMAPTALVKGAPTVDQPGNVSYMGPYCMGQVPQRFSPEVIAQFLYTLHQWGFFGNSSRWNWFWIAGIGELVLKPFGLYEALYNPNTSYIEPSHFFSLSPTHIASSITPNNPTLTTSQFYLCRPDRPSLIVNMNLLQNLESSTSAQIPIQATPVATGIPGQSPDGTIVGGGAVESFGFTSTLVGPGGPAGTASVATDRRYSLCDMAGCSSAFFAAFLLEYLNNEINTLIGELEQYLIHKCDVPPWLAEVIGNIVKDSAEDFLDAESAKVIPQYNYWPAGSVTQMPASNTVYGFSDGGDFENTGILGLLAQTDAESIISFINTDMPISKGANSQTIVISSDVPQLFGFKPDLDSNGNYVSWGGMSPDQPFSYVQVFSNANGEFEALCSGLYAASCGSGASPQKSTAYFQQTLTTVDNPVANIKGGRQVQVLWVYNNRVDDWQNQIRDQGIQSDLAAGQAASPAVPSGPLANFPVFNTETQIYLVPEAVNMLAQLSAWNVNQVSSQILGMLNVATLETVGAD